MVLIAEKVTEKEAPKIKAITGWYLSDATRMVVVPHPEDKNFTVWVNGLSAVCVVVDDVKEAQDKLCSKFKTMLNETYEKDGAIMCTEDD